MGGDAEAQVSTQAQFTTVGAQAAFNGRPVCRSCRHPVCEVLHGILSVRCARVRDGRARMASGPAAGPDRKPGSGVAHPARAAIHASISSERRGSAADIRRAPSAVITRSSSMRTPIPRSSGGSVRSSGWR